MAARSNRPRLIVSALLHAAVLILAIGVIHEAPPLEPPPEQGVAVVFESGSRQGSPAPSKTHPEQRPSAPPHASAAPGHAEAPTRPPAPEAAPVPPPAPGPLALRTVPPLPAMPSAPEPLRVPSPSPPPAPGPLAMQEAPPLPAAPHVPQALSVPAAPVPPPEVRLPAPELPAAPPLPVPPLPIPARPAPHLAGPSRARPGRSAFPAPMNLSLSRPSPASRAAPRSRGLDLSMGPVVQGGRIVAPHADFDAKAAGTDWEGALMAWVDRHKYYPQRAAMAGEDGSATVLVKMQHDGRVQSVELETSSGSEWLDIATLGMFRGAMLPALPDGMLQRNFIFHFTMHYVLARGSG